MSKPSINNYGTPQPAATSITPPPASALLLVLGGALMMLMYAFDVVHTLISGHMVTREEAVVTLAAALHNLAFNGCLLLTGVGLAVLAGALRPHTPRLAPAGLAFAALAATAAATNIGLLAVRVVPSGNLGGVAVIANLTAAALLGTAALRSQALTPLIGRLLLITGVITFPIILLTFPLEAFLPEFVIADLPFLFLGATLAVLGLLLRWERTRRPAVSR